MEEGVLDTSINFLANPKSHSCINNYIRIFVEIHRMYVTALSQTRITEFLFTLVRPFSSNRMFDGLRSQ